MNKAEFEAMMMINDIANEKLEATRAQLYLSLLNRAKIIKEKINNIFTDYVGEKYWMILIEEHFRERKFSNGLLFKRDERYFNIEVDRRILETKISYARIFMYNDYGINIGCTIPKNYSETTVLDDNDIERFAEQVSAVEKIYETFVEALPEIYELIAEYAHKKSERRLEKITNAANISGVKTKEKKITRVVIEVEEV